jgi:hypothetical protein
MGATEGEDDEVPTCADKVSEASRRSTETHPHLQDHCGSICGLAVSSTIWLFV